MNEQELIERYFMRPAAEAGAASSDAGVVVGIGDDAAIIACDAGTARLVLTADTVVEGRHFTVDAAPADVGHKALAVALSDVAAMGASPRWATLCLSVPFDAAVERWIAAFAHGFFALANRWGVALVGGDLVQGPRTVSVQLSGGVDASRVLLRSGARAGDGVYLTGTVGDAGLAWRAGKELEALDAAQAEACKARLHRPQPRVGEGLAVARLASAAIDVSDGLLCDLSRLAQASDATVRLEVDRVPLGDACVKFCRRPEDWIQPLTGGDDYELLFTMDDEHEPTLEQVLGERGLISCTRIGEITAPGAQRLRCTFEGAEWPLPSRLGFDHFQREEGQ